MDNSNSNKPSDPNPTNPFANPATPAQNVPGATTDIGASPISASSQPSPVPDLNISIANPTPASSTMPSTPPTTPIDPSNILNNNAFPSNPAPASIQQNPLPPNNTPDPLVQPAVDPAPVPMPAPQTTGADFLNSLNSVAPNSFATPATTAPTINDLPDMNNSHATTDQTLNMGSLGSTNTAFNQPSAPSLDLGTPNPSINPTPTDPAVLGQNTQPNPVDANTYNPAIPQPETPAATLDSAPTDLSHLIDPSMNVNSNAQVYTPSLSQQPETLVVPGNGNDVSATPTAPTTSSSHFPKWLIGVGIVLIIIVAAASAYFILGVGQQTSAPEPASLPAQQETQLQAPPQSLPQIPESTSSGAANNLQPTTGSFGQLNNSTDSASTSSTTTTQPKSAADILRQRQATQTQ